MIDDTTLELQRKEVTRLECETAVNDYRIDLLPRMRKIDKRLDRLGAELQRATPMSFPRMMTDPASSSPSSVMNGKP